MDSDDEELAALRAQRNARLGISAPVSSVQRQQDPVDDSRFYADPEPVQRSRPIGNGAASDSDEDAPVVVGEDGVEDAAAQDAMRQYFPVAFGSQEKPADRLEAVHEGTRRKPGASAAAAAERGVEDDEARPPLPPANAANGAAAAEAEDGDDLGPPRPAAGEGAASDDSDDDDDSPDDPYLLPVTHEVTLQPHAKLVTTIAIDRAGARLLTGGDDYALQMFDFGGMKRDMRSFRQLEPTEGYPINAISWSPSGDAFLVVTGSSQPKIYDRDGHELGEFVKGDMYIRDATNTKGHQYRCCGGQWHPNEKFTAATCSEDGTVRIWDTETIKQKSVLKPTLRRAGRVAITTCAYNNDGTQIAAGLMDGSLQLWDVRGKVGRSAAVGHVPLPKAQMISKQDWSYVAGSKNMLAGAHEKGDEITCLAYSADNNTLLSRCMDDTLKVWDARRLKTPLAVFSDLPTVPHASVCFSPDEQLIATGTARVPGAKQGGALVLFDRQRMELVRRVEMGPSVAALAWHDKLNQIFVGSGDRKGGTCRVLYDPAYSEKGALLAAGRRPRSANPLDFEAPLIIKNPHALPMYRDESQQGGGGRKRKAELDKQKALKTKRPDAGASRPGQLGKGGAIGATGGSLLTQHVLKQQGMMMAPKEEDARALFLRHGDVKDDKDVHRLTQAYKTTQPKRIYHQEEEEDKKQ